MTYVASESFAAVDLGSNSFHMIVANYSGGRLQIIDRIREMVRLASGLDENQMLVPEAMQRALDCLDRFGQRLREIPRLNVRAVGTNTLRQARNGEVFLERAREALGHPIEVIAGREEARLIFLGIAHTIYDDAEKRLVVDIGGGSTELIIGRGFEPFCTESLYMGCVSVSRRFFADGQITAKRMQRARLFALQELESVAPRYREEGWEAALGSSGTILSVSEILRAQGRSDTGITVAALSHLCDQIVAAGNVSSLQLAGLSERRRPVFPGGVAVLAGIFESLQIDRLDVSDGALREGLLYDLIGRVQQEDIRDKTVSDLQRRYAVDDEQGHRVTSTAEKLYLQLARDWQLNVPQHQKLLLWAARLHEIGLSIAHSQYHRHGAYLLSHSDLPGFSRQDQANLAVLVRAHRRRFPQPEFEQIARQDRDQIRRLAVILRLAALLHRSRSYTAPPDIRLQATANGLLLRFPKRWLAEHPLTQTDLEAERDYLTAAGFTLTFT